MKSLWNDAEAEPLEDVALRVYSSRLLGQNPALVLHGGGNTSLKTRARDILGQEIEVLRVKGSGQDLASITPDGLVALDLASLRRLRSLSSMSDAEMTSQLRRATLDASAPAPSLETFLHAFLPARFVDHTHADAILVLGNQPDGAERLRQALGPEVLVLPWVHPGFALARAVADAFDAEPGCEAIVILHHGIFTFAEDARTSYERMIELVSRAERCIAEKIKGVAPMLAASPHRTQAAPPAEILPRVRGALARPLGDGRWRRLVCELRDAPDLAAFASHPNCPSLLRLGPLTPDHLIRTRLESLFLHAEQARDAEACREAVAAFAARYESWFTEHASCMPAPPKMSDPLPRVVVVEGLGLLGFGEDKHAAIIAADIAAQTLRAKAKAAAIGRFQELSRRELFRQEYWPLERRKLGDGARPPLAGQVALVTGAAGAIGHGIARVLLHAGAQLVLTDLDAERLESCCARLAAHHGEERVVACTADVTEPAQVAATFERACLAFGGVDIVVPNAGIAHVSTLEEMDPARFAAVLEVNVTGTMLVLKQAARVFRLQQSGGAVIVQASKNVFDPGAGFGAYSASKAGVHQLGKIAALELAPLGVTVNMVNADAVFGDEDVPSGLWAEVGPERMAARGLDPKGLHEFYAKRSLLGLSVTAEQVGQAVLFFASARTPTTGATLPVDAGIKGAFPR